MRTHAVLSLITVLIAAGIGLPAAPPAQQPEASALSAEERRIANRLQAIDESLRHRLRYVEEMAAAGREPDAELLEREAGRFQRRLRLIEGEVSALEPGSGAAGALLDKVRALAKALGNLERAAEVAAGAGASPASPVDLSRLLRVRPAPLQRPAGGPTDRVRVESDPGTYRVQVSPLSDYLPEVYDDWPCPGRDCGPVAGDGVEVSLGSVTSGIDFALDLGGTIAGSVSAATGEPISSVWVTVYDAAGNAAGNRPIDGAGDYEIRRLAAGTYFAYAGSSRYGDELYDDIPCPDGPPFGCNPTAGTPIEVAFGTVTAGVDFVLDRLGEITGTVTDQATGAPIVGVDVYAFHPDGWAEHEWTNIHGRFTFGGLVAGTYFVKASGEDHSAEVYDDLPCPEGCDPMSGTPITVADNATASGIDFALRRLGAISGTVIDAVTGAPVQEDEGWVDVWSEDGHWASAGRIDAAGDYQAERLQPGTYFAVTDTEQYVDKIYDDVPCPEDGGQCQPTGGTPIAVELETVTSGIDFALDPRPAISGTVTGEATGEPIGGWVRLWNAEGHQVRDDYVDGEGRYRFRALDAPGPYFVTAHRHGFAGELYDDLPCPDDGCDPTGGTPIAVEVGTVTSGIDFALTRLGAITGRVVDAVTGAALDWPCVKVWDGAGTHVGNGCVDFEVGYYVVESLAAGTYFATAHEWGYLDQLYDRLPCPQGCDPTTGTPITVERGTTTEGIDFALDPLGGISGQVTDAVTGEAFEYDAWVSLWNVAGEWVDGDYAGDRGYTFEPLPSGTYFLTARADGYLGELYREIPCPEDCDPTIGTPVTVAVSQTTAGVDFTLEAIPLGSLAGAITDELTGEQIPNARVTIWEANGDWRETRDSDLHGRYVLDLPPGFYFAGVTDAGSYHAELFDNVPCGSEGCDPITGTPITVAAGHLTPGIDFPLRPIGAPTCMPAATDLCLGGGDRFRLEVDWRDHQDSTGAGRGVELTRDSGYFWFFHQDNVEVVLKVLDACATSYQHFWVFAAGLTDVECQLKVTDTWTGEVRTWDNPLATPFAPIQATRAFATCDAAPPPGASPPGAAAITKELEQRLRELDQRPLPIGREINVPAPAFTGKSDCVAGDTVLCLSQARFAAEVRWRTPAGRSGDGRAVPLTADTGTFWFFGADNVELMVKVLDGCAINDRFWVFAAGLTNVEVTLTVTDTVSGQVREYLHPMGTAFPPIQDTGAFDTCQ